MSFDLARAELQVGRYYQFSVASDDALARAAEDDIAEELIVTPLGRDETQAGGRPAGRDFPVRRFEFEHGACVRRACAPSRNR